MHTLYPPLNDLKWSFVQFKPINLRYKLPREKVFPKDSVSEKKIMIRCSNNKAMDTKPINFELNGEAWVIKAYIK